MALVTAIFPSCAPADIEQALARVPGLDLTAVKVVTKEALSPEMDESDLDFIGVSQTQDANSLSDDLTHNTGYLSDSGGTGVPGMDRRENLADFTSRSSAANYLGGIGVSRDIAENYNEAVDEGRCVVACQGDQTMADALRAAGFRNVRIH